MDKQWGREADNAGDFRKIPLSLVGASAVILGEAIVRFATSPMHPLNALSIAIAVLLAGFLARGSRIAWLIAALGAATGFAAPVAWHESWWVLLPSVVIGICLIAPASMDFVWKDRPVRPSDKWIASARLGFRRVEASSTTLSLNRGLMRLGVYRPDSRPLVKLQSLLAAVAVATAALFVLMGAVAEWHHGGGSDSVGVDVLWWVVWIVYTLAKLILVGVLLVTIYQWYVSRRRSSARL